MKHDAQQFDVRLHGHVRNITVILKVQSLANRMDRNINLCFQGYKNSHHFIMKNFL